MKNECDGSGRHKLCSTKTLHKHCECGEPIGKRLVRCVYCENERRGISNHRSEDFIKESLDHTSDLAAVRTDYIGYSPFKRGEEIYQFGFTEVISQKEIDKKSWDAKNRDATEPLSELALDHLE